MVFNSYVTMMTQEKKVTFTREMARHLQTTIYGVQSNCKNKIFMTRAKYQNDIFATSFCAVLESSSESAHTKQFAFSQAAKCLVQTLLLDHPKISFLKLTESGNNVVFSLHTFPPIETRTNLETLLIGLYAGKVGELFTNQNSINFDPRFSSLQSKSQSCTLRQRKDLVRVNGLFANRIRLQAKKKLVSDNTKTKVSQILYACDTLYDVSPKYYFLPNPVVPHKIVTKTKVIRAKLSVLHNFQFCTDEQKFDNLLKRCTRIQSIFSIKYILSRKQYHAVPGSLGNFALEKELNCGTIKQFLCQLDLGLLERIKATFLVQSIIVNGSTYSPSILNLKKNSIVGNLNKIEIQDKKRKSSVVRLQNQRFCAGDNGRSPNGFLFSRRTDFISQKNQISGLCEEVICKSLTFSIKPYGHWFRIYLPQIETHQRQPVSTDKFMTKRRELGFSEYTKVNLLPPKKVYTYACKTKRLCKQANTHTIFTQKFAHVWPQELGYSMCHNLVLNTFSRAFTLIGQNRELLDLLADHFIRFEKIRMPELSHIYSLYLYKSDLSATLVDQSSVTLNN